MRIRRNYSIRQKLTRIVLVTCGVSIVLACTAIAAYDVTAFRKELSRELATVAEITGSNLTAALAFGDSKSAGETLNSLTAQPHIVQACVYSPNGSVFAGYARDGRNPDCPTSAHTAERTLFASDYVSVSEPIQLNGESIGTILVRSDLEALHARTARFVAIVSIVSLLSFVAAYVLASRLQRVISVPIVDLAETAAAVSTKKDYSLRAEKKSNDEVGSLVDRFNEMLARIQEHEAALRSARDELEARVDELEARVDERTSELRKEITDRKQAESELEERESFLHSLIKNTPVGIAAIDTDNLVRMCNPAFEQLFGYRQEDVLGKRLAHFIAPPERVAEVESNSANLWLGKSFHAATQRKRRDGSLVDVEAFSVPLGPPEKPTGGLLLYHDITERNQAERALLRAKEAAEAASRAKSEFLANMSHEIRTPMNGIIGMTELTLDTTLTSEQREYLDMVKASAHSLLTVINDILDFSKIEAGKLDVEIADFPLQRGLGETLKVLAFRAHQKGLELAWRVGPGVPEFLKGDVGRLRQVLVNLVGNALKFTERGEVVVSVDKEAQHEKEITLHFQVHDTGIGIPKEKQQMIFGAFTQADSSASRKYGGTGLGLAITSRLVALMGGRIWVESEVGQGSTFHFTARLGLADGPGQPLPASDQNLVSNLPVLIVDDNETNRRILVEQLARWGMRPEAVDSGAAALSALVAAHLGSHPFRIVISDMRMPGMDGCALAQRMQRTPALAGIPIVLLSSSGLPGEANRCNEVAVSAYLTKPAQPSELLDAMMNALFAPTVAGEPLAAKSDSAKSETDATKVLLVEDNPVNCRLAIALLEKHDFAVIAAENGKEALDRLDRAAVDLILMDVQMPVMDGFEAIRVIREKERATGAHMPIIALTAHAMKGDRERCLAAGADDYVAKPIRTQELLDAIDRAATKRIAVSAPPRSAPSRALDFDAALARVDGDRALFEELCRLFVEGCPRNLMALRVALDARDLGAVRQLAHTIKGAAARVGSFCLSRTAHELETQADAGDLESCRSGIDGVQSEFDRLQPELEAVCRKVAS